MKIIPQSKIWAGLALTALLADPSLVQAADTKVEARLIWGTNDEKSPNPDHKKVDDALAKKLKAMPFKWNNFFEVNRTNFTLVSTNYTKVVMSKQCSIDVKDSGKAGIKVKIYGQGKEMSRIEKSPLPKSEILAIAGDSKNESAWLITLKRTE